MAMPEVSETDFAIIVFREDDRWEADVLPVAVTGDLSDPAAADRPGADEVVPGRSDVLPVAVTGDLAGFIRVLRQQPSIAGTIGLAGIDDYFFVAVRVVGSHVSLLLSDIGAALDYPLAEQVLDQAAGRVIALVSGPAAADPPPWT